MIRTPHAEPISTSLAPTFEPLRRAASGLAPLSVSWIVLRRAAKASPALAPLVESLPRRGESVVGLYLDESDRARAWFAPETEEWADAEARTPLNDGVFGFAVRRWARRGAGIEYARASDRLVLATPAALPHGPTEPLYVGASLLRELGLPGGSYDRPQVLRHAGE